MKFVNLKCPSCGAMLKADAENDRVTCEECGATFSIDEGMKNARQAERESNNSKEHRTKARRKWEEACSEWEESQHSAASNKKKGETQNQGREKGHAKHKMLKWGLLVCGFFVVLVYLYLLGSSTDTPKEGVGETSDSAALEEKTEESITVVETEEPMQQTGENEHHANNPIRFEKDGVSLAQYTWAQTDSKGYQIEKTMTITGWVHGNDEAATNAAWAAVGGVDEAPNYERFLEWSGFNPKPADCVILYGNMTARNITPGFSLTPDNPYSAGFYFTVEPGECPGAFCYQSVTGDVGVIRYIKSENFNYMSELPHFNLTSDDAKTFIFAIAFCGGAPTPNNGGYDPMLDGAYIDIKGDMSGSKENDYWVGCPHIVPGVAF